jgi:hypothetical protein
MGPGRQAGEGQILPHTLEGTVELAVRRQRDRVARALPRIVVEEGLGGGQTGGPGGCSFGDRRGEIKALFQGLGPIPIGVLEAYEDQVAAGFQPGQG